MVVVASDEGRGVGGRIFDPKTKKTLCDCLPQMMDSREGESKRV